METPHLEHPILNRDWILIQLRFSVDVHGGTWGFQMCFELGSHLKDFCIKSVDYQFHIVLAERFEYTTTHCIASHCSAFHGPTLHHLRVGSTMEQTANMLLHVLTPKCKSSFPAQCLHNLIPPVVVQRIGCRRDRHNSKVVCHRHTAKEIIVVIDNAKRRWVCREWRLYATHIALCRHPNEWAEVHYGCGKRDGDVAGDDVIEV